MTSNLNKLIIEMIRPKPWISYEDALREWLGPEHIFHHEVYDPPPRSPTREERLIKVMTKRYGVPQSLVDALLQEVEGSYW